MKYPFPAQYRVIALAMAAMHSGLPMADTETTPDGITQLEKVVVTASTYRNTASKTALPPEKTPQGISTVTEEQFKNKGAASVSQALRYTPGVNTELRGGGATRMDQYTIRGFTNFQNFYDGLQIHYNNSFIQPQIDPAAIAQIEVFKGPTSVLYGGIPPGGMVNIIARQPSSNNYDSIELATGSHNRKEATFQSTGAIAGNDELSYTFTSLAREKDSQIDSIKDERYMVAGGVDWQISDRTLLNMNLYHQKDPEAGVFTGVPATGSVLPSAHGSFDRDTFMGDKNWNDYDRDVTLLGYKLSHTFNDNWSFLQNTRFMDAKALQKLIYENPQAPINPDGRTIYRVAQLNDEKLQSFTIDNQLSGMINTGSLTHNVLAGFDYQRLKTYVYNSIGLVSSIDLLNPDNDQVDPNTPLIYNPYQKYDLTLYQNGIYLQDQILVDQWVMLAGLRYDNIRSDQTGITEVVKPLSNKVRQNNLSGRLGVLYTMSNGLSPFASYAEGFEAVPGSDRRGKAYEPSTSKQWEAGIKYAPETSDTVLTLSTFRITKDNVLTKDPSGGTYDQIQAGQIQSKGFEIEATSQVNHQLLLDASVTFQDVEFTKDNAGLTGKTPSWVPEKKATLWLSYFGDSGLLRGTEIGGGVRYIGEAVLDVATADKVPSYSLVDMSINSDLGEYSPGLEGTSLNLSVTNLFNKRYYSCYDQRTCFIGAERTVKTSVNYEF
ncbi:TonB-dependent siderophore receptor [Endozoicomonas ascidiicola]|uniref:TonB-dependent siderophore receptor n=1 Tax=Endozoicomonas ascidiicola TaxID=1698521 RepID=UPI000834859C|nr:TonB-dependent siderophore receptor [Endozoicomonas ascidiicola]